jgi:hypothetical protein
VNIENLTLGHIWVLTSVITIATSILYVILKDNIKLGMKALVTWTPDEIEKLHEEHGQTKTIFWTFIMFFVGTHTLQLFAFWIWIIIWTLGIWSPH